MRTVLALALFVPIVASCQSFTSVKVKDRNAAGALDASGSAYLAFPKVDQTFGTEAASAAQLAIETLGPEIDHVLAGHVTHGAATQTQEEALASARDAGSTYLVFPEVFYWAKERDTFISSRSDQVRVRLSFFDASSGNLVDSADLQGSGETWLGTNSAKSLLRSAARTYLEKAF